MKKVSTLLIAILACQCCIYAQPALNMKKDNDNADKKHSRGILFSLNWENWLNAPGNITVNNSKSRGVTISTMRSWKLGSSNFGLALGMGISSHNIGTNVNWDMLTVDSVEETTTYTFETYPDELEIKKNKFSTTYLDVPLELHFNGKKSDGSKGFNIAAGFRAGYLINSHTKYKDSESKRKEHNLKSLAPFRYGVTGRIGFGNLSLFGYYALSTLFEEGKGADIVPMSIGLAFVIGY